ncbi:TorF family putative porin [Roseomonas sp. 18066]|uniref:TorF family putative porin n=1 Tax=Roseomonas sp. 18066 TaxID=2681412 RepID=UPI001F3B420D|nr:TorF family putative porin [Roseomonas sp. 18066]
MRPALPLTLAALLACAGPAAAQLRSEALGLSFTALPVAGSDYLFRGISQTRSRPALQLTLEAVQDSGFYLGAFGSQVAFAGSDARQELDLSAGFRFDALGIAWDIGAVHYGYPGHDRPAGGYRLDYVEAALKASRGIGPVTALASVNLSPDFFARSGLAVALEGGADIALPGEVTLSGRLGHQWIEREARFGAPDYLWYSIGLSRELAQGVSLAASYAGTDIGRADCGGGQKICDNRFMLSLSRRF